jgi:hypothetical protein
VNGLAATVWAVVLAVGPASPAPPASPASPSLSPSAPSPGPSSAQRPPAVIAVVAPPFADPAVTEALSRFRGEAVSVGFEVTVVTGSTGATPLAQMESAAHAGSAVATVAFVSGGDPRALDVWFTDRLTGKTVEGHVSVENESGDRAPVVLAVKAVDFLRARMFDFLAARPRENPVPDEAVGAAPTPASGADSGASSALDGATRGLARAAAPPASRAPRPSGLTLSLGVAALRSLQGLGTMVLPLFRAGYGLGGWSSVRLSLGGLGTRSRVDAAGGSATVAEDLAMAEWVIAPGRGRLRSTLCLGVGVHDVRATGEAAAPYTTRSTGRLLLAGALSAGVGVALGERLSLVAEAGAFVLAPEPQVRIAGLDAGRTGRPGLSLAVTVEARL